MDLEHALHQKWNRIPVAVVQMLISSLMMSCVAALGVNGGHTRYRPDSLVVRASASGAVGRGFAPRPRHTKGGKNGTGSSLADARNKRVYQKDTSKQVGIRYMLCRSKSSTGLMLTVSIRDFKQSFFIVIFIF